MLIAGGTGGPTELPNPSPDWMSDRIWKDILVLPTLPNYSKLAHEFSDYVKEFKKVFDSPEPHKEPLPGHWNKDLDEFQKMLVLKCLRADKLSNAMQVSLHVCTCMYMYMYMCNMHVIEFEKSEHNDCTYKDLYTSSMQFVHFNCRILLL